MGIPYSREINAAFEQVTPLVAAAYQVLETIKNIAVLLAYIQVLTVILLSLILMALLALIYSVNPDLAAERKQLVTPVMQWLASWTFGYSEIAKWAIRTVLFIAFAGICTFLLQGSLIGSRIIKDDGQHGQEGQEGDTAQESPGEKKDEKDDAEKAAKK